ncbi:MAG TPA: PEPxxWA-CTERM sorting domain-containing protein [Phenylobacterium sp.]
MAAFAGSANAAIFIGLQQAGVDGDGGGAACVSGGICTKASGAAAAVFFGTYGSFEMELLTGTQGVDPALLGSTTSDTNSLGAGGTLDVYVTRTDIDGPVPLSFFSSFTSNVLPAGWTVTQSTYVSTANALYTGTLLSSHLFTAADTFSETKAFAGGAGPYSVTTRYTLTAPTTGNALSTVAIASVPEPGTWALMITGFGGAGAMIRRRRRAIAA